MAGPSESFGGMVFRCNPDGSAFEVLAHNFRHNYELAVDSFATVWQSDNDDAGNRGVVCSLWSGVKHTGRCSRKARCKAARTECRRTPFTSKPWYLEQASMGGPGCDAAPSGAGRAPPVGRMPKLSCGGHGRKSCPSGVS
jgi:hypothetical protein